MGAIRFTVPSPTKKGLAKSYSLNSLYSGRHWAQRQKDAAFWHRLVHAELRRQGIPQRPANRPVEIVFRWNDRLDCSNHAYMGKLIEDALKGWLIIDDSRKYVRRIIHDFYEGAEILVGVREV